MRLTALACPPVFPWGLQPISPRQNTQAEEMQVEEMAQLRLRNSGRRPLGKLSCQVTGTTARLTGRVPSFFLKQVAQETVRHVVGIDRIENDVEVVRSK